ncbi:MAG: hypothetical protein ACK56I_34635, partial [bacterium]
MAFSRDSCRFSKVSLVLGSLIFSINRLATPMPPSLHRKFPADQALGADALATQAPPCSDTQKHPPGGRRQGDLNPTASPLG